MNSLHKVTGGFSRAEQSSYAYDKNGNLTELVRWAMDGTGSPELIDAFAYHYTAETNRLTYITDEETTSTATNDMKDPNPGNYDYDLNGQLTADEQGEIASFAEYSACWLINPFTWSHSVIGEVSP